MDLIALESLVDRALRDQFPEAAVSQVIVDPDLDSDGASILRITVVLDDVNPLLGSHALVSFVRYLRARLAEADRDEFPLLSFVDRVEAKKLRRESA
jgi:hypothetical protein